MTDTLAPQSQAESRESLGGFNYEAYRMICDQYTMGSRKAGLLDEGDALQAVTDPDSIIVKIDGSSLPVLAPIKYAPGYDAQRCSDIVASLTGQVGTSPEFLAIPPRVLLDESLQVEPTNPTVTDRAKYIFAEVHAHDEGLMPEVLDAVARNAGYQPGYTITEIEISEPNPDNRMKPEFEHPDMRLYAANVNKNLVDPDEPQRSFSEAVDMYLQQQDATTIEGTKAFKGADLAQNPGLLNELWAIYKDRFGWLAGGTMPVSLEDTYEEFASHVTLDTTTTMVVFGDQSPRAFMYFSEDAPTTCSWLNPAFFQQLDVQRDPERFNLFFPGVVARPEHGNYMEQVVTATLDIINHTNRDLQVTFESTNISAQYIPRMVRAIVNGEGSYKSERAEVVDYHRYRLYQIAPPEHAPEAV